MRFYCYFQAFSNSIRFYQFQHHYLVLATKFLSLIPPPPWLPNLPSSQYYFSGFNLVYCKFILYFQFLHYYLDAATKFFSLITPPPPYVTQPSLFTLLLVLATGLLNLPLFTVLLFVLIAIFPGLIQFIARLFCSSSFCGY